MTICSEILNRKYTDNKSKPLTHITTSTACFSHLPDYYFVCVFKRQKLICAILKTGFEATHTPKPVSYCYIQLSNRLSAYCLTLCVLRIFCSHHPTNFLSAVKLNRLLHYFVVHTTCTLSVHWTIPHCLSSLSTFLRCFIMQSAYITI